MQNILIGCPCSILEIIVLWLLIMRPSSIYLLTSTVDFVGRLRSILLVLDNEVEGFKEIVLFARDSSLDLSFLVVVVALVLDNDKADFGEASILSFVRDNKELSGVGLPLVEVVVLLSQLTL